MAITYEPIATTTLSSVATSFTFSSIPSTYTDLKVVIFAKSSGTSDYGLRAYINGDTGSNYSETSLQGYGSAVSQQLSNNTQMNITNVYGYSNEGALATIDFLSYSGATYKTALVSIANDQNGSGAAELSAHLWRNTAAVNSLNFWAASNDFAAGTSATLYGILKA